eukprot:TRINITY_DN9_c0_g2_i1.p2 TRINITY_DN9_c0_g2~~TRINITY_DN9_c0_g2_i1.p2  ORF type:complete len:339 (+),score=75.32 TRINITY_DN9_c0_g2_i1:47-1018(+)
MAHSGIPLDSTDWSHWVLVPPPGLRDELNTIAESDLNSIPPNHVIFYLRQHRLPAPTTESAARLLLLDLWKSKRSTSKQFPTVTTVPRRLVRMAIAEGAVAPPCALQMPKAFKGTTSAPPASSQPARTTTTTTPALSSLTTTAAAAGSVPVSKNRRVRTPDLALPVTSSDDDDEPIAPPQKTHRTAKPNADTVPIAATRPATNGGDSKSKPAPPTLISKGITPDRVQLTEQLQSHADKSARRFNNPIGVPLPTEDALRDREAAVRTTQASLGTSSEADGTLKALVGAVQMLCDQQLTLMKELKSIRDHQASQYRGTALDDLEQ